MRLPRQRTRQRTSARRTASSGRTGRDRRPVAHRRTRSPAGKRAEHTGRRRRTGLTSRAAVLVVAIGAVVLTLAVPVQQYLAQRAQLRGLAAQERAARERVASLQQQQARWNDPAYVREQARARLHFVKPGETAYVIVDPALQPAFTAVPAPKPQPASGPWYGKLWSTVTTAAQVPTKTVAPAKPRPATPKPITPPAQR